MKAHQDSVSARLQELRKRANYTRPAFAKALGYKHASGIQRYEQDGARPGAYLPYEFVMRLLPVLVGKGNPAISEADVLALGPPMAVVSTIGVKMVPLLSWSSAVAFSAHNPVVFTEDCERIPVAMDDVDGIIALRVSGESMNRIAPDGSIILVDTRDDELRDGKRYIFLSGGETTFKLYRANPARFEPESTMPHDTIFPSGRVEIVGRVIKVMTDL